MGFSNKSLKKKNRMPEIEYTEPTEASVDGADVEVMDVQLDPEVEQEYLNMTGKKKAEEVKPTEETEKTQETDAADAVKQSEETEKKTKEEAKAAEEAEKKAEEEAKAAEEAEKKAEEEAKAAEEAEKKAEEEAKAADEAKKAEKARKAEEAKRAKEARKAERAKKAEAARRKIMEAEQSEVSESPDDLVAEEVAEDTPNGLRKIIKRIPRAEYEALMSNNPEVQEEQSSEEISDEKPDAVDAKDNVSASAKKNTEEKTKEKAKTETNKKEDKAMDKKKVEAPAAEEKKNYTGRFEINKSKSGEQYFFNLYAANKVGICTSQMYSSANSALHGVQSVINFAATAPIEDQTLKNWEKISYPKWEIYVDKGGKYRFRLNANNGSCICHSQGYTTKNACKNGIDSIIRSSRDPEIDKAYLKKPDEE